MNNTVPEESNFWPMMAGLTLVFFGILITISFAFTLETDPPYGERFHVSDLSDSAELTSASCFEDNGIVTNSSGAFSHAEFCFNQDDLLKSALIRKHPDATKGDFVFAVTGQDYFTPWVSMPCDNYWVRGRAGYRLTCSDVGDNQLDTLTVTISH